MQTKSTLIALLLAALAGAGGLANAADTKAAQDARSGAPDTSRMDVNRMRQGGMGGMMHGQATTEGDHQRRMMQGGMMDMMDMMSSCGRMMNGSAGAVGAAMPQLPPSNEKLQLQMHAEMMQKICEILSSYAARIKDEQRSAR